jgi:predicted nucleotidyltransferase
MEFNAFENTYKMVFHYIQASEVPVSPHELSRVTGKSRVSVHTALKKLIENKDIEKIGVSPRVTYAIKGFTPIPPSDLSLEDIQERITPILKKYPIIYAGIFGSVAEGLTTSTTVDIMISPNGTLPMISLTALETSLTEALGKKVTLATDQGANKFIKASMMKGLKVVYGKI